MMRQSRGVLLFLFLSLHAFSQEVISPLQHNLAIKNYLATHTINQAADRAPGDTIDIPFMDDFSFVGSIYPDESLWLDHTAYINADYPVNPITIGVATFDGLDEFGDAYQFSPANAYGVADYLTSKPINLGLPAGDSVYFSFFYQPQGLSLDSPEQMDSLVLEFYDGVATQWKSVWNAEGSSLQPFKQVMIPITQSGYLQDGFQFRFKNYATLTGNWDQWHIDYVRLDNNRSVNDTLLNDLAFTYRSKSLLKRYQAMPWKHYKNDPASNMVKGFTSFARNNDDEVILVDYYYQVLEENNNLLLQYPSPQGSLNVNPGPYNFPLPGFLFPVDSAPTNFIFPVNTNSYANFKIKNLGHTSTDINRRNDTTTYVQRFQNYYAYDDGTAEEAYGLTAFGGKIAYEFNNAVEDTLKAVAIFFSQKNEDVSDQNFKITIWSNLATNSIIYQQSEFSTPVYTHNMNGYSIYTIDETVIIPAGTFYVGMVQEDNVSLNIGIDLNNKTQQYHFYNTSGTWNSTSIYQGSLMIRPYFGDPNAPAAKEEIAAKEKFFRVYPNPAVDRVYIVPANDMEHVGDWSINLYDLTGRKLRPDLVEQGSGFSMDISNLPPGIYLLSIGNNKSNALFSEKLIITR